MRKLGFRVCVGKLWEGNWSLQRISIQLSCLLESNCGSWCAFGNCNSTSTNPRLETSCYSSRPRRYLGPVATELNFGPCIACPLSHPPIPALELYVWERRNDEPHLQQFCNLFSQESFVFVEIYCHYIPTAIVLVLTIQFSFTTQIFLQTLESRNAF